jgi:hypothetical protein
LFEVRYRTLKAYWYDIVPYASENVRNQKKLNVTHPHHPRPVIRPRPSPAPSASVLSVNLNKLLDLLLKSSEHDYIDLVFYHRFLRCHVLLDLKIRPFSHGDAGQMNFYLNYFKQKMMATDDNPPVGVILCSVSV